MKLSDKLSSLLQTFETTEPHLFVHWVIQKAELEGGTDVITGFTDQANEEVFFHVNQLSGADLAKLRLFFRLPEDACPINNRILVDARVLSDAIYPQFESYVRNLAQNRMEGHGLIQMDSSVSDGDDSSFDLVDSSDYESENDSSDVLNNFPWLAPDHPLYFPATQSSESTRWGALDKFSVENWYAHLREYTFESRFITLNYEDILFLMGQGLPAYDSAKLERTFDSVLAQFNNREAFMRLSTRSPKDSQRLFDEAATTMSRDFVYWKEAENQHQQLVSFVASMTKAMKMTNAKNIIETIAESPRVFSDLLSLVSLADPSQRTTKIIFREWYDIRPDHEFRLFVSRRCRKESIVTAIAPYFHFLYFDKMPADCFNFLDEQVKNDLVLKFQNYVLTLIDPAVARFLNFSSEQDNDDSAHCIREYIVDLALIPINQYHGGKTDKNTITLGGNTYAIVVIELNPFAPAATGSALFHWQRDLMMLWGKAPGEYPTFAYRTTPREDIDKVSLLPTNYKHVIERALAQRVTDSLLHADVPVRPQLAASAASIGQNDRFFAPAQSTESAMKSSLKKTDDVTKGAAPK